MNRLAGVLAATAVFAAACGGESDDEAVINALAASIVEDDGFDDFDVSADEADCTATIVVDQLGRERVIEIGFSEDPDEAELDFVELTDDEIDVLATSMETCIGDIDEAIVSAIAAGILEEPDADFPVDQTQARCVAEGLSDALSLSRLIVLGVQADDTVDPFAGLDDDEADAFANAFVDCIDLRAVILDSIAAQDVPDEVLACFDEHITDDQIATLFRSGFRGAEVDAASEELFLSALEDCP